ncbi:MAG: tRNA pseudouridine(55) synthase TruB [Candidatus Binatia bacterium]
MESGILLLDKPEGPASTHLVQKVKDILGARKVGHLGALDPFASGLLLLGINDGTKIAQIFLNARKSYTGVVALGAETDTQDRTGRVLRVREVPLWGIEDLETLRAAFTGSLSQIPPMYSALKRGGVRLYRLARQGKSVPRPVREVEVERLRLWRLDPAELGFDVTCSKGTYIRTLAADMGRFLGCGGHLKSLRRLSCGHFTVDQAVSLEELNSLRDEGKVPLIPLNQALGHIRQVSLKPCLVSRLRMGQQEVLFEIGLPKERESMLRLSDWAGNLVALVHWVQGERRGGWRLFRVFAPPRNG